MVMTYLAVKRASESALLRLFFFHDHSVVVGSCGDDHRCESVATVNTLVVHDVLWVVLTKSRISGKFETLPCCNGQIQT